MIKIISAKSLNDYKNLKYEVLNIKCLTIEAALQKIKELKAENTNKIYMIK